MSKAGAKTSDAASDRGWFGRLQDSPRTQRRFFVIALAVFAAGALALTISLFRNTASSLDSPLSNQPAQVLKPQKTVPLSDEAKQVATTWIMGAVTRKDLAGTFDLTHPDIRGEMTRAEWESGNIPVVPFPLDKLYDGRWHIDYSYADEALVEVGLIPGKDAGSNIHPTTFFIGLKKVGTGAKAHWVVNYWSPRYKPPVPLVQ